MMRSHPIKVAVIVALSVLAGAECVGAAINRHEGIEAVIAVPASAVLPPAELDPAFAQKLVERMRGPFERSHHSNSHM